MSQRATNVSLTCELASSKCESLVNQRETSMSHLLVSEQQMAFTCESASNKCESLVSQRATNVSLTCESASNKCESLVNQ